GSRPPPSAFSWGSLSPADSCLSVSPRSLAKWLRLYRISTMRLAARCPLPCAEGLEGWGGRREESDRRCGAPGGRERASGGAGAARGAVGTAAQGLRERPQGEPARRGRGEHDAPPNVRVGVGDPPADVGLE